MEGSAQVVAEVVVRLELDGRPAACWTCSPDHLAALAAGWLHHESLIESATDIEGITEEETDLHTRVLRVRLRPGSRVRDRAGADCGPLARIEVRGSGDAIPAAPSLERCAELLRRLFAEADESRERGGVHAAALVRGDELLHVTEDVGRHNTIDKVIGRELLGGGDPSGCGLVSSARISGEIAYKAARSRLAWIASRSVPTSLALEVAARAGIAIAARAGGRQATLFHPDGRVETRPAGEAAGSADG